MKTIKLETIIGENEDADAIFKDYLDLHNIAYTVSPATESGKYPEVEYTGDPLTIKNMLVEKFGYTRDDFESIYPDLL